MRGENTKFLLSCTAFLFLCMLACAVCVASARTIFVPDDYAKIQWAVSNASTGDTIIVRDGIYVENIDINKQLTIKSENGSAKCIVRAANKSDHVFEITADYVAISGFTVKESESGAGIYINESDFCVITNNYCSDNNYGIHLWDSKDNKITNNTCFYNDGDCIYLNYSDRNEVINNICSYNGEGIRLSNSSYNEITSNDCSNNNGNGISLEEDSDGNQIANNICSNNWGSGISLRSFYGSPEEPDHNQITNNTCSYNYGNGIGLSDSDRNSITNNICSYNGGHGISVYCSSSYNEIIDNICSYNDRDGIYLGGYYIYEPEYNKIINNTFSYNYDHGIYFDYGGRSLIYLNNFIDNADNARSDASGAMSSEWDSPVKITYTYKGKTYTNYMGNYWSDYTGSDKNGDGIGDTSYEIAWLEEYDYYPLMEPWENYFPENKPPIASFTHTPENPVVDQTITFDASSSYDPDGTIVSYDWDFDDGNTATGKIVNHAYASAGEYIVTLTVTDNSSLTNSTTRKVKVIEEGIPNISWNMTISATNQLAPVIVGMHPNATDGYDSDFDVFAQTPVQGKVILILDGIYSTSIKKTRCYNESVSWNLSVGVPAGQTTNLSWDVPSNVNLTISEGGKVLSPGSQLGEGSHELTVTAELLESQGFSINLKAGWNMVSLPLIPDNRSVYAIFGSIPTLDTMPVVTWEAPSFVVVEEIEPKIGYWVFAPSDTTINIIGNPITNTTLILKAGWNMVGTVGIVNLSISDIPNQVPERPAVTWVAPSFVETDMIEPGKSAWVFVTADTTVTIGKTASTVLKAKAVPMIMNIKSITSAKTEAWNLTISATNQLESVTFGIHPDATNGYDEYDAFAQTPVQGKVIMILDDIYATEINKDKLTWNLSVGVPAGQNTTLTWDFSKIPADVSLSLDGIDMKLQNSMELGEGSHSFVIRGSIGELTGGFDTGKPVDPYPSIFGTHKGTIKPNKTIIAEKLYTYPCAGTGGHTEYALICNSTWCASAKWEGYKGDWKNIIFNTTVVLMPYETYDFTIITGSYPQIHHNKTLQTQNGWINCTEFTDANGNKYDDWIPTIKLW